MQHPSVRARRFELERQPTIDGRIIARETIAGFRKDVTAKCHGGDVSRKRELLEQRKEGERRVRRIGNVDIPRKVFLAVLGGGEEAADGAGSAGGPADDRRRACKPAPTAAPRVHVRCALQPRNMTRQFPARTTNA